MGERRGVVDPGSEEKAQFENRPLGSVVGVGFEPRPLGYGPNDDRLRVSAEARSFIASEPASDDLGGHTCPEADPAEKVRNVFSGRYLLFSAVILAGAKSLRTGARSELAKPARSDARRAA